MAIIVSSTLVKSQRTRSNLRDEHVHGNVNDGEVLGRLKVGRGRVVVGQRWMMGINAQAQDASVRVVGKAAMAAVDERRVR